ncbi:MAG: molybdopterin-guanine dinucleotide biosynthesis protein B [Planctomycetales bacterium]
MKRIHIIGRKNSGKTTLIVELVEELTARGYAVGTIKHTHHRHDFDVPGKDSHRHRTAGACVVGLMGPDMSAVFLPTRTNGSDRDYDALLPMFADCDLLLVEGDARTSEPKIEVWRAATGTEPLAADDPAIIAVVTDDPLSSSVDVWPRSEVPTLCDRILENTCRTLLPL